MNKRFQVKGRSNKTNQNKKRQLTKKYHELFKASLKKKKQNPQGTYFCDKFKTAVSFLSTINLKQPNITK